MNLIVAVDRNWGIGCGGELLARIPEDMKYFREMTMGKIVVMGRKTFESLPNGALPNRRNVVLSRDKNFAAENIEVYDSTSDYDFPLDENVFVIGGAEIYRQALPYCTRAYVTKIDAEFPADRFMENLDILPDWQVESSRKEKTQSGIEIEFVTYVRKS